MTEDVPAAEQFAGSGLVRFEHEHAAIAKSAVKDHYPGLPDMVEGVSTYGRVKDVRYKGIPLSPDFRGDNSPGRMPGRGNVSRSMEFSQEGITSSINAFGIDALIKHIDQHIDYSVTGPMYLDKETGQLAPPEGAAGPYRHVPNEPHLRALRSVRDMLAEIRSEHPELGPEQGYRVHNLDTEGLMERYSGPKFTKDDATKARGELEAAIRQLKGTSTKHLSDYEAPSTTSMMITEKMIEHAISDLHNQGFDGPYGIAGSTVGKTLIALHPDVASKYRLITDYLQFEDRAGATGMMRSIFLGRRGVVRERGAREIERAFLREDERFELGHGTAGVAK